jgi:hypothetical protein
MRSVNVVMPNPDKWDVSISRKIAKLPSSSRQQLLDLWEELYGKTAPPAMRRGLLIPFLAYRLQEKAYGGLKPSTRAELRRIARTLAIGSTASTPGLRMRTKPGTRFVREWRGKTHEVLVTESGFEYGGEAYCSLSPIARKITGTCWSGPAFFGLSNRAAVRDSSNE